MVLRALVRSRVPTLPGQFWLLFWGRLVGAVSSSMWFPFLTLYLHQQRGIPMLTVGLLFSAFSFASIFGQMGGGSLADRLGRKPVIIWSLCANAVLVYLLGTADRLWWLALLSFAIGLFGMMLDPAESAAVADLAPPERRNEAYGLLRVAQNVGIVVGPSLGGLLAVLSYQTLFTVDAAVTFGVGLALLVWLRESRPIGQPGAAAAKPRGSYLDVLRDGPLLAFLAAYLPVTLLATQFFSTLPVFLSQDRGISTGTFGLLAALNGMMVVTLQLPIANWAKRHEPRRVMAAGALLYALGFGGFAPAQGIPALAALVAVFTLGELLTVPVASAYLAAIAPPEMRGRYMGLLGLSWTSAMGVSPVLGGAMLDALPHLWLWVFALALGCLSCLAFLLLRPDQRYQAEAEALATV